jgi:RNA polymerase sigma-70 factor (ECF subfamily)
MRAAEETARLWEIEQIYRTRLPELCRVAAAISGSRQAAPDLVQEAFVRAVRRIETFRGDGPLEGWLWRIVVNVASNSRREPLTVPLHGTGTSVETGAAGAGVARDELSAAMALLSERQRLVLFLRYYADLDYGTIAEALAISSGTVGATLTAGRAALGHALEVKEAVP